MYEMRHAQYVKRVADDLQAVFDTDTGQLLL